MLDCTDTAVPGFSTGTRNAVSLDPKNLNSALTGSGAIGIWSIGCRQHNKPSSLPTLDIVSARHACFASCS